MQIKQVYPESAQAPSSYCKYFFRGEQSSGDIENLVSGGALAVKNAGFLDATLWASAGYAAIGGGAGNYCTLAPETHDLTLNGFTLVVTARVLKSTVAFPGAEQYFVSSYNPGSTTGGIILACRTDGAARLYCNAVDGTAVSVTTAANTLTNGAAAVERSLVFVFPRESGQSARVAVDGIEVSTSPATTIAGKSLAGGRAMRIGGPQSGAAVDAYKLAAFGAYLVPINSTLIDKAQLYDWAFRNPGTPMPDWVFQ